MQGSSPGTDPSSTAPLLFAHLGERVGQLGEVDSRRVVRAESREEEPARHLGEELRDPCAPRGGIAERAPRERGGRRAGTCLSPVFFFALVSKMSALIDAAYCAAVSYETRRDSVMSALLHAMASTSGSSTLVCSSLTQSLSLSNEASSVMAKTRIAATAPAHARRAASRGGAGRLAHRAREQRARLGSTAAPSSGSAPGRRCPRSGA